MMSDTPDTSSGPADQRCDELYIDDGNVVLVASARDGSHKYFRVHKSTLSRYSNVFRDMFATPSPPDIETYDGVPIVRLPDSAEDVQAFLKALYDVCYLPFLRRHPDTTSAMVGPLRMATKYQVDGLRSRIITHLESFLPLDVYDYLEAEQHIEDLSFADDLVGVDCDIPSILPAAFYKLLRYPDALWMDSHDATFRGLLSREDFDRLYRGRQKVEAFYLRPPLDQLRFQCAGTCQKAISGFWLDIISAVSSSMNPIEYFRARHLQFGQDDEKFLAYGFCEHPDDFHTINEFLRHTYESIWTSLPEAFRLEGPPTTVRIT